jgi:hypothetical protein
MNSAKDNEMAMIETDAGLIEVCKQHIANYDAFNACPLDDDESPPFPTRTPRRWPGLSPRQRPSSMRPKATSTRAT